MNIVRQCFCRSFQLAFRAALPILPYRNPELLDHIEDVPHILQEKKLLRPMLVTDQTIRKLGITKDLEDGLRDAQISVTTFDQVEQNPTTSTVERALEIYRDNHCNCLIAFGGGSPMDCAKAVGARIARPRKSLAQMAGILRIMRRTPFTIAVPTTAGTGSETTLAAVIVDDKTRHKYVINDFPLIPDVAVLDPTTIHSLPKSIAAATGMDAMTHAVEAYIGRSTTASTRADATKAVKLIFENLIDAANHTSVQAERNMLLASHLAGRAFTRSYVGYIHAVSHSLSGKYNSPHGLTNAVLLPIVLEQYGPAVYKKLAELAVSVQLGTTDLDEEVLALRFIQAIYNMNAQLGIPRALSDIQEKDVALLAHYADKEANPLYPVPTLWDQNQLKTIYRKAVFQNGC